MYLPEHFNETRLDVLHEFVRQHPLASLITLGSEGLNANHKSIGSRIYHSSFGGTDDTHEPIHLAAWAEFHVAVNALPDDERATFDLLWYQGLSQPRAAALLDLSERTIRRRWRTGRARVLATLTGESFFDAAEKE